MEKSVWWGYVLFIALGGVFLKIFATPLKKGVKIGLRSFLGALVLWVINLFSPVLNIHVGINVVSSLLVGVLGVPGICLLMLLQVIF